MCRCRGLFPIQQSRGLRSPYRDINTRYEGLVLACISFYCGGEPSPETAYPRTLQVAGHTTRHRFGHVRTHFCSQHVECGDRELQQLQRVLVWNWLWWQGQNVSLKSKPSKHARPRPQTACSVRLVKQSPSGGPARFAPYDYRPEFVIAELIYKLNLRNAERIFLPGGRLNSSHVLLLIITTVSS